MRPKTVIMILLIMNMALVVSNAFTTAALRSRESSSARALHSSERRGESPARQTVHLESTLRRLERIAAKFEMSHPLEPQAASLSEPASLGDETDEGTTGREDLERQRRDFYAFLVRRGIVEKPDPATTPLITAEERTELERRLRSLPNLDEQLVRAGDVHGILQDLAWNPKERHLAAADVEMLHKLVNDYVYYSEYSHIDRYWQYVFPAIPEMRKRGEYIDYWHEDPPPRIEGALMTHAENADEEGYLRLYYFMPEDHSALAHHKQVEREQLRVKYVEIYDLINLQERAP